MLRHISRKVRRHKHFGRGIILFSLGMILGGAFLLWVSSLPLPDFASFEQRKVAESTKIYDRTGEVLLFDVHKDIKRTVVPLSEISRHAKNATIAIEDSEFYSHRGIKPTAIMRALFVNILSLERTQGGSTITQQVIKNSLLSNEKRLVRKIKEAVLAIKLERVLSKDAILEIYLNESPYGGNLYGIEEASLAFFGKKSADLTLAESAYLAAFPQAPTYYSPYGAHTDQLAERKNTVLVRMVELGFIENDEAETAKMERVVWSPQAEQSIKAPHFVMYVREFLEKRYGSDVDSLGLRVITTLDWGMQGVIEKIAGEHALRNKETFNAENVGVVVIDPKTGHILSMVGSRNYFDEEIDGNFNVTLAHRQPGSAIKPFVYATAFKKGYTPNTAIFDLETQFSTFCDAEGNPLFGALPDACYKPVNYDGKFRGPITMREALAQSINIPAVKTLYLAGLSDSLKTMKEFGIESLSDINRYGLTLVLGGGEVTLLELTSAYGVFAREGVHTTPERVITVEDKNGVVLYESRAQSRKVIDENITREINSVLSDNVARAPAFGYNSPLYIPEWSVAAKTGTTNDYRDAWIVGYTPEVVVGAWAGNNDNSSMEKNVAGFIVAPMWNAIMREMLPKFPNTTFTDPEKENENELKPVLAGLWRGGESYFIDSISGKRTTEFTPAETKERKVVTNIHSILYWVDKNNPRGQAPNNPGNDPQFNLWETSVRKWAAANGFTDQNNDIIPREFDDMHTPENKPVIVSYAPMGGAVVSDGDRVFITVQATSKFPPNQADFFWNDKFLGSIKKEPYTLSFVPKEHPTTETGGGVITIRVYDTIKNNAEVDIPILLSPI